MPAFEKQAVSKTVVLNRDMYFNDLILPAEKQASPNCSTRFSRYFWPNSALADSVSASYKTGTAS
jgi:uncharacterized protein YbbC (DUF1343 family)